MQTRCNIVAVAALVLACAVGLAQADLTPGNAFPFYDACRHNASSSRWSLRMLQPPVDVEPSTVRVCFVVRVNTTEKCIPETFTLKGQKVVSRCCNTTFAKIKFYVDPTCRSQFSASPLTVPLSTNYSKVVSPTWDSRLANYTDVKYTQFGPIPQNVVNGTTFCLTLKKTGPCNVTTLGGITNPADKASRLFQVAMYDRKEDEYECCPTFAYSY